MRHRNTTGIAQRFEGDTSEHALTVIRDDGLYRHLRCQKPGTYIYGFDIVTWPGYLAYVGDMGDFVFTRVRDMFEFFRGDRINPDYWSEKLCAPSPEAVMEFDRDAFDAYVREHRLEVVDDWGGPHTRNDACRLLVEAGVDPCDLPSLERYGTRFLWCCHALVWAIARYDQAAVEAV